MELPRSALLVATAEYDDPDLSRLRAPVGDVDALAEVLADPAIGGFHLWPSVIDRPHHEVQGAIETFLKQPGRDLRLLYLSCHGVLDEWRRLHFAATNTRRDRLRSTAIFDLWLHDAMDATRAKALILVLDCCHSGAFGRHGAKGVEDVHAQLQGHGRVVLTASSELEYAFEDGLEDEHALPRSAFTRALVEGLRTGDADLDGDDLISVRELYDYTVEHMGSEAARQRPQLITRIQGDIFLARRPASAPSPLPEAVRAALEDERPSQRKAAIEQLVTLAAEADRRVGMAAARSLEALREDDSREVRAAADSALRRLDRRMLELLRASRGHGAAHADPVIQSLLRRAERHLDAGRIDAARQVFEQTLARDADIPAALVGRGETYLHDHRVDAALEDFRAARKLDSKHVGAIIGEARALDLQGQSDQALGRLEVALEIYPDSSEALCARGWALLNGALPDVDAALRDFNAAIAADPHTPEGFAGRGFAQLALGHVDLAGADFERTLAVEPSSCDARAGRARVALRKGISLDSALADLEAALDRCPTSVLALVTRSEIRQHQGDVPGAEDDLERALHVNPGEVTARIRHAQLLAGEGRFDEALADLDEALKQRRSITTLYARAQLHLAMGQFQEAVADLDVALRVDPDARHSELEPWRLFYELGVARTRVGSVHEAMQDLRRAAELNPEAVEPVVARGTARLRLHDWAAAIRDFDRALAREPRNTEAAEGRIGAIVGSTREVTARRLDDERSLEAARAANVGLLEAARLERDWSSGQRDGLVRHLRGDEDLLWLCRCRWWREFRSTALLVTDRQLLWSQTGSEGPDVGRVAWADVSGVTAQYSDVTVKIGAQGHNFDNFSSTMGDHTVFSELLRSHANMMGTTPTLMILVRALVPAAATGRTEAAALIA